MMKKPGKILLFLMCITLIFALAAGCGSQGSQEEASDQPNEITDMAGRTVTVPNEIRSVFSTSGSGTIMLYTIDPELLVGVNYEFNEAEKEFILEKYRDLPAYGQGAKINLEAVIAAAPDICISFGSMSEADISEADNFQTQTGIPVVMLDGALTSTADTYKFLGKLLRMEDRTDILAAYAKDVLDFASAMNIPENDRVTLYYGNGMESLETAPAGSPHAELIELVQGNNVAALDGEVTARINIGPEQIIGWNPEVILLNGEPKADLSPFAAVENFKSDQRYKKVQAVVNNQVYAIPKYPFSWFDRPPAVNRLIGVKWLAEILYPDTVNVDIEKETIDFYNLFYHMELTKEQLTSLLGR